MYIVNSDLKIFSLQKKNSSNPSEITRIDVWIKAHTKKNGEPSSSKVVEVKVCVKFIDDNLDMLAIIIGNIIINNSFLSLGNV